MSRRPEPRRRGDYPHHLPMQTRWLDNDAYQHVNNVVYYAYFDTVVNEFLVRHGVLDIGQGEVIGLVVETHCNFFRPVAFPQTLSAGLRVAQVGRSSVHYEVGIFGPDDELACAQGHLVHVYVDRAQRRPAPLPPALREALRGLENGTT